MIPSDVAKLRAERVQVAAEIATVQAAPAPPSVTKAAVEARVKAAGARFIDQLAGSGFPATLEEALARDPVGAWCAMMPEKMVALAMEGLRRDAKGKATLSANDRAAELARLSARRLDLEKREEAAIRRAERNGVEIDRRADADPRAVLARLKENA